MLFDWVQAGPTVVASFLASTVEFIEALTIMLAVGTMRGWRDTLLGGGAAVGVLLLVVALLGSALTRIPLDAIRVVVGTLLLLFGLRWLHKAILRGAGVIALHDEATIYVREQQALRGMAGNADGWDKVAFALAFKSVLLEGTEVVFIVLALAAGGTGLLWPASIGALAALFAVVLLGVAIRQPLSRVPENTLKFVVGVLLSAFGTFWAGEGFGVVWPGHDWAIGGLVAGYLMVAFAAVAWCRPQDRGRGPCMNGKRVMNGGKAILRKVCRLFVDDAFLAVAVLLWLAVVWLLLPRTFVPAMWCGVIEFLGLAIILTASALHRARRP